MGAGVGQKHSRDLDPTEARGRRWRRRVPEIPHPAGPSLATNPSLPGDQLIDRLVDLIVSWVRLFKFFCVVRDFEGGVILRFGRFHREAIPGFHWMWPFEIEELIYTNVVDELLEIGPQSLTTRDDVAIVISTVITFSVKYPRKFLLDVEGANQAIADAAVGVQSRYVLSHKWADLLAADKPTDLLEMVRKRAWRYGVEVKSVEVKDFTRSRSFRILQAAAKQSKGSWDQ